MQTARAINLPLDGQLPDWIQLLPAGPRVHGADGRAWTLDDPAALITAFQQRHAPLVVDWEHASEHRAPHGLDAPAAGWIHALELRNGQVWGNVEWTGRAVQQIQEKEYRYLSPVFNYRKDTRQIVALTSVALTNQPNLPLTALNREESPMPLSDALCQALEIPAGAEEVTAITRVNTLKDALRAANAQAKQPPLDTFVPRADYDALLARATNAEQKLAEVEQAQRQARIAALLQRALTERKISPATQEYYQAMCKVDGGIEAFETFLSKAPPLLPDPKPQAGAAAGAASQALNRATFSALSSQAQHDFVRQGGQVTD
jgi:phage I-like protein